MIDKLRKDYKWLFEKSKIVIDGTKRRTVKIALTPTIIDNGSSWLVYREKDSSPLILSKNY